MKVEFKLDTSIEEDRQELEKILNGVDHKIDHAIDLNYLFGDIKEMLFDIQTKEFLYPEMWETIYRNLEEIIKRYG